MEGMLATLLPLHEMMHKQGPTTLKEIAFVQVRQCRCCCWGMGAMGCAVGRFPRFPLRGLGGQVGHHVLAGFQGNALRCAALQSSGVLSRGVQAVPHGGTRHPALDLLLLPGQQVVGLGSIKLCAPDSLRCPFGLQAYGRELDEAYDWCLKYKQSRKVGGCPGRERWLGCRLCLSIPRLCSRGLLALLRCVCCTARVGAARTCSIASPTSPALAGALAAWDTLPATTTDNTGWQPAHNVGPNHGCSHLDSHACLPGYLAAEQEAELHQAWDLYYHVFKRINKQLPSLTTLDLQYVAPALVRAQVSRDKGSRTQGEARVLEPLSCQV